MLKSVTVRVALVALAATLSLSAHALADAPKKVDVPAGDLTTALETLAKQSGVEFVYSAEQLKGIHTNGVRGNFTPERAVLKLLEGTKLKLTTHGSGALLISENNGAGTSSSLQGTAGSEVSASSQTGEGLGEESKKKSFWDRFRLAQVDQGKDRKDSSVESAGANPEKKTDEPEPYRVNTPEVLIVGSRVMNVDVKRTEDDVQPYYILDSKQIEQSGATNVEEFLKSRLTMNTTFLSNSQSYGSGGGATSSINLRGLGTNETLILINGRRSAGTSYIGAFSGRILQTDINGIPLSAIERIEVLPSSASAIYGGAAVGGVVNIILKRNFQGGEVNAIYENTASTDAPLRTLNATYGFSLEDGKTRIMLAGHYADAQALLIQDRLDLVGHGIATILKNSPAFFNNAANPFPGATTNIASADGSNLVLKGGTPLDSPITFVPSGAAPGSNLSTGFLSNAGTYNLNLAPGTARYGLQNAMGTVPRDKSFMATIRREFTSSLEVFTEFSTLSNSSRELYNPFSGTFSVPSSAPNNPFQQGVTITFPSALSGSLATDSVTQSATAGLLARLPGDWKSELDYTWSRNSFNYALPSYDYYAVPAALAAGTLNPFVDTIAHPLNLAPYVFIQRFTGNSTLNDLGLRASGSVGSLPWGRPTLTIGFEHRKEGSHDGQLYWPFLDPANTEHFIYFGQSQSTNSVYAEAQIPLMTARNALPLIRSLELQLAGRSERYTVNTGTALFYLAPVFFQPFSPPQGVHKMIEYTSTNPTIGLKYRPVKDLTFRASYAKAFLPPTADQFLPNPTPQCGFPCVPITDPRNGQTYNVDFSQGGNPNLRPQTARDWDLGVIWEPQEQFLKGLRMDLEYYKITQPDYITNPGRQQVVSDPAFASRVTRDPTTGRVTVVDLSPLNATEYKTDGWDLTLDYRKPTTLGTLDLHAVGTVIEHDQRQYTIGGPFLDYVGYPSEQGEGKTKANATLSWEYRQWTVGWTTTYYGSYLQYNSPGGPYFIQFGPNPRFTDAQGGYTLPSQMYHDLFASYVFDKTTAGQKSGIAHNLLSNLTVQLGIKNLFNTLPPFDASNSAYFYSPYGDPRLRSYRISVRKGF